MKLNMKSAATEPNDKSVVFRATSLQADLANVGKGTYQGQPHIIVPVVCMVGDSVIRPKDSLGWEYVPSRVIGNAPEGWNGRPVLPFHPETASGLANEPKELEAHSFGQMFHTVFRNNRLQSEVWLNLEKAKLIGSDAEYVVTTCETGSGLVEISIGGLVWMVRRSGIAPNGKRYDYIWSAVIPDHLAMGMQGSRGACNTDMGCGAPRALEAQKEKKMRTLPKDYKSIDFRSSTLEEGLSSRQLFDLLEMALAEVETGVEYLYVNEYYDDVVIYTLSEEGSPIQTTYRRSYSVSGDSVSVGDDRKHVIEKKTYEVVEDDSDGVGTVTAQEGTVLTRILNHLNLIKGAIQPVQAQDDTELSDSDLRGLLWTALNSVEPAFVGIEEHYPNSLTVVYAVQPEDDLVFYSRTYSLDSNNTVLLDENRQEVEPRKVYVPVGATSDVYKQGKALEATSCSCAKYLERSTTMANSANNLVVQILASEGPYTDADAESLSKLPEEGLQFILASLQSGEGDKAEKKEVSEGEDAANNDSNGAESKVLSGESEGQGTQSLPPEIRDLLKEEFATRRARALEALKKNDRVVFSLEDLQEMGTRQLELLVQSTAAPAPSPRAAVDYSIFGIGDTVVSNKETPAAPPSLTAKVLEGRGIRNNS